MSHLLRRLLNLPPAASSYAGGVDCLHFVVISLTMLGSTLVFVLAMYFTLRYRRHTEGALTQRLGVSLPAEVALVVALHLLFLGLWAVGAVQYSRMETPPSEAMRIYVTAKQWMWKFSYPGGRASLDVLTVPAQRNVVLVMTSRDVIHSFYVPAFRIKQDVVPGRYQTLWFRAEAPGVYPLRCAEFCGTGHSSMLGRVQVMSAVEYAKWLADPAWRPPEQPTLAAEGAPGGEDSARDGDLAAAGRDAAVRRGCFSCHTVDGQRGVGPSWARLYDSTVALTDGRQIRADESYLTRSMMDPQVDIVAGYKAVMPTYRGVLSQPEVAALVEYIETLASGPYEPSVFLPRVVPETEGQPQEPRP